MRQPGLLLNVRLLKLQYTGVYSYHRSHQTNLSGTTRVKPVGQVSVSDKGGRYLAFAV